MGSLIAALASYLDARHHRGLWLVRMEDLDPPREEPGAADSILHSLRSHGLLWDEPVMYQSARTAAYAAAAAALAQRGLAFHCACTRSQLGPDGVCRGQCPARQAQIPEPSALRVTVPQAQRIAFEDALQGSQQLALGETSADFVIRRRDGLYAYQLAVVVDDAAQAITHIVRGADLLDSTPRQIYLQQQLDYPTPHYCHLPVITTTAGQKFSKQNHAPALVNAQAPANLRCALRFLQQQEPPPALSTSDEILAYAIAHWALNRVPAVTAIPATAIGLAG
jgi:glutamyl-Q tRNA(Asp) synthetase